MLQRVITLEAAAPLLITAILSAGAGLLAAHLFLRAQLGEALQPPGAEYYGLVLAGLTASLADPVHPPAAQTNHRPRNRQKRRGNSS